MSLMLDAARIAAAANVVFLLGLISIWVRNYREIRSPMTLGSTVFATLLLAENGLAFYYYTFSDIALSAPAVRAMMYLQLLEAVGVGVLTYVTWR